MEEMEVLPIQYVTLQFLNTLFAFQSKVWRFFRIFKKHLNTINCKCIRLL